MLVKSLMLCYPSSRISPFSLLFFPMKARLYRTWQIWAEQRSPSSVLPSYWVGGSMVSTSSSHSLCVASKFLVFSGLLHADLGLRPKIHLFFTLYYWWKKVSKAPVWVRIRIHLKETLFCLYLHTGFMKEDEKQGRCSAVGLIIQEVAAEVFFFSESKTQPVTNTASASLQGKGLYFVNTVLKSKVIMDVCFYPTTLKHPSQPLN